MGQHKNESSCVKAILTNQKGEVDSEKFKFIKAKKNEVKILKACILTKSLYPD